MPGERLGIVQTTFKAGDKVRVVIPELERVGTAIRKYNNTTQVISKITKVGKSATGYIELEGVTSDMGVPFAFAREWLVPTEQ